MAESHEYTEHRLNNNSEVVQDQQVKDSEVLTGFSNEQMHLISGNQELGLTPEYMNKSGGQQDANPGSEQNMEEENGFEDVLCKLSDGNHIDSKLAGNDQTEANNLLSSNEGTENLVSPAEIPMTSLINECLEVPSEDTNKNSVKKMNPPVEVFTLNSSIEKLEASPIKEANSPRQLGHRDTKILRSKKKNHTLRSLVSSDRVLRSRIQEKAKAPEPSTNLNSCSSGAESRRKKKKKMKGKEAKTDEFSVIRKRLKYLVNRMKYEQNLIEAYSSEGWKGFSSDKLKPEKELQRASSEIMRRKMKIRDLFQHLDSLCAEGRFSESLFDAEGQIDSEDIFCAQCGSKELSFENDIVLCDGACDRGFHQFCLEPPLLNTDIPPDDEGWLCPGCDCKDDCLDLINEFQGTKLSITDSWEKVYPEAAAAAAGRNSDHASGLPSDDSEDDDYNPDAPDTKRQEDESSSDKSDESSSDESGYASAPDELEAPSNDDQILGLPSDDSDDGNYDPDAPELDLGVNPESSSSDFTSDSEDLTALDNNYSSKSDDPICSSLKSTKSLKSSESDGQSSQHGPTKGALHRELLTLLEPDPGKNDPEPVSGRRKVERLDYKRLHDEQYGTVSSDSSDGTYGSVSVDSSHDGGRVNGTRKRSSQKMVPGSLNNGTNISNSIEAEHSSKKRTRQKPAAENVNNSVTKKPEDSQKSSSSGRRTTSSSHRSLGQPNLERLFASFKENQYPERATQESLAQELGLSLKQVSKWFVNTRWSTRHPSGAKAKTPKSASSAAVQSSRKTRKMPKLEQELGTSSRDADNNGAQHKGSPKKHSVLPPSQAGDAMDGKSMTVKTMKRESPATKSRKRKGRSDRVASRPKEKKEPQKSPAKSPKVNETKAGDKAKIKRRKSV